MAKIRSEQNGCLPNVRGQPDVRFLANLNIDERHKPRSGNTVPTCDPWDSQASGVIRDVLYVVHPLVQGGQPVPCRWVGSRPFRDEIDKLPQVDGIAIQPARQRRRRITDSRPFVGDHPDALV
ncbi:hypothetical protein D3C85_1342370 [compost metagenome]